MVDGRTQHFVGTGGQAAPLQESRSSKSQSAPPFQQNAAVHLQVREKRVSHFNIIPSNQLSCDTLITFFNFVKSQQNQWHYHGYLHPLSQIQNLHPLNSLHRLQRILITSKRCQPEISLSTWSKP